MTTENPLNLERPENEEEVDLLNEYRLDTGGRAKEAETEQGAPDHISEGGKSAKTKATDKPVKQILWISVKKDTTVWNVAALVFGPAIVVAGGAYINAVMPYLLQDESYFGIPFEETGTAAGEVLFWSFLVSTCITPFLGYVFDLIGRFWFLIPSLFLMAL